MLYVGVTGGLPKRVFQHKRKEHEAFTARCNSDRLVWFETRQESATAIFREKELKGWRRKNWRRTKKIALLDSIDPVWTDL
jgi:putative endonuclease